jgi:hypothetical protein
MFILAAIGVQYLWYCYHYTAVSLPFFKRKESSVFNTVSIIPLYRVSILDNCRKGWIPAFAGMTFSKSLSILNRSQSLYSVELL